MLMHDRRETQHSNTAKMLSEKPGLDLAEHYVYVYIFFVVENFA